MDRFELAGLGIVLGVALAPVAGVRGDVALALGLAAAAWRLAGGPRAAEVVAGVALGLLVVAAQPVGPRLRGPVTVVGAVLTAPTGRDVDVVVSRWAAPGAPWVEARGRVRVRLPEPVGLAPGDGVVVAGVARPPWWPVLPGGPDPGVDLARGRARTVVHAATARRLGGDPRPPDASVHPLLRALVTGDRRMLSDDVVARFRATGTSHLLAVSGSNVALAAGLASVGLRALRGAAALRWPGGWPSWPVVLGGLVGAVGFAVGVGLGVGVLRAGVAAVLVGVGWLLGRRIVGTSLLAVVASLLLVWDPAALGAPSFQLSFGAVAGLLGWGRVFEAWARRLPWAPRAVVSTLGVSVAATIGTLPAGAWWFQEVPPLGPLANLVAVPWCGVVLVPAALVATLAPPPLAPLANTVGGAAADALVATLALFEAEPWRLAVGPAGAIALALVVALPRRPLAAAALAVVALGPGRSVPATLTVTFPDVGQGAAALVEHPDGTRWLVDGGRPGSGVAAWLRRAGVRHLDVVVASHGDLDHAGGLVEVVRTIRVGALHVAGTDGMEALLEAAATRGVPVVDDPGARVHPHAPVTGPRNDASVVIAGGDSATRFVLPGDVSAPVERAVAETVGDVVLLALAHHGSRTSTDPAWLAALAPELAVVQAGRPSRYGHPAPEVVARVRGAGAWLGRTDRLGTIEVTLGATPRVRAWGPGGVRQVLTPSAAAGATPRPRRRAAPPRSPARSTPPARATARARSTDRRRPGTPR